MNRSLVVDVRRSTWPRAGRLPAFPPSFHRGAATHDINVTAMLLLIGYLTTPTSSTGVTLSEFWAWVRYLAAVTGHSDLRLTRSFADLDAHQKTILSDDFGMGVPMLWLNQRLPFDRIVDGRYFMQRIAASVGATQRRAAKRGPNKTPDFVARDTTGDWHVVECKGTQSGHDYCGRQLESGRMQKLSIVFPPGHTGQRLVCGLAIGVDNGDPSRLTIIDPEPEDPLELRADQLYLAEDAAVRGVMSKALRLSGFETTAEATAAPLGRSPAATRYAARRFEEQRRREVDERDQRARAELEDTVGRSTLFGGRFRGRERTIELPRPVLVDDEPITRAIVRQGVNQEVLAQLRERPTVDEPSYQEDFDWTSDLGRNVTAGDERTGKLVIGDVFRSELILE